MAGKAPLKVVPPGARARVAMTVLEAAESGSYLDELLALRRRCAAAISNPETPARDLAALMRRQLDISKEIRAIESRTGGDEVGNAAGTPDEEWATS